MIPDAIDLAILRMLSGDATLGAAEIGRVLGLTQPAIWRRIRKMRDFGIISGQRVVLDSAALGFGVTVFLGIRLATKGRTSLEEFERAATAIPEVQLVQHVLGQFDYRLRIVARDIADFERILRRRIMTLPGLGQVEANVMLSEERCPGPLGDGQNSES
ncbi:MAG: Lrp/AsnC family transcriptional regulator [Paracoccus sp. (in: a-proteobacteria)]